MLLTNQTASIISTYTADVSGVCSALFEFGGMTVMHDPSGCNSTYNTHDEPRWYDTDSMVFISGLTEMQAIMGDDSQLIHDVVNAAEDLSPEFIALCGTPIPMMTGTDFSAIAKIIEKKTGIPTCGINTNGMHSYIFGAGLAFAFLAERMTDSSIKKSADLSMNILGTTPLDFSVNGYTEDMNIFFENSGFRIVSKWGVGGKLSELKNAGSASVNLVVSSCGLEAARILRQKFGTPYIIGTPIYGEFSDKLVSELKGAAKSAISKKAYSKASESADTIIIAESVTAGSIIDVVYEKYGISMNAICPPDTDKEALLNSFSVMSGENSVRSILKNAKRIIADPLYKPICPSNAEFIPFAHEAFSGRIFRSNIKNLIKNF